VPRPTRFMDTPDHCDECAEVEEKAQNNDRDSLTFELANENWASLHNFLNDDGFLYYFPAFIRLCIESNENECFATSLLFAITYEGERNGPLRSCSDEQREFIHQFLLWYRDSHGEIVHLWGQDDEIEIAIELWSA